MEKQIVYYPQGVCSRQFIITLEGDTVKAVNFVGGCDGNLKGIASLVRGMKVDQVILKLKGISCGAKITSCPDQFAKALEENI